MAPLARYDHTLSLVGETPAPSQTAETYEALNKKFPVLEAKVEYWFERNSRIIEIREVCTVSSVPN